VSRVMSQWETLPRHREGGEGPSVDLPVTVAAAALGYYVIAGGRGGALHSANTSQYIYEYNTYKVPISPGSVQQIVPYFSWFMLQKQVT
jgi:hypothetical protein